MHVQKCSDDTAIVGRIRRGDEGEYRSLVKDFSNLEPNEQLTAQHLKDEGDGIVF